MKLLIYSHYFAPSIGGVEIIVQSLASGISELHGLDGKKEFDVTVITETAAGNFDDGAFPFRIVRRPGILRLWKLIADCDLLHAAGPALLPLFLAWLSNKRFVIEHHGYQAICPNGLLLHQPDLSVCPGHFQAGHYGECVKCLRCEVSGAQARLRLELMFPRHWLSRIASLNIAVSNHVRKRIALLHTDVVYHGIAPAPANGNSPIADRRVSFAYAGRLVPEKGIAVLLDAAKILKNGRLDFEIQIIGDGAERQKLETHIRVNELDSCVRITGFLTGEALANALRNITVMVMPSIWEETAGLAAMEQMMRGRLVIVSDIGGLGEIVGGSGLTYEPGDANALAARMRSVILDRSIIERYGQLARTRASVLFERQRMIEEHARIYRALSSRPGQDSGA
jgi:glycosyltransferase involved in cell wall biosynthesis